MLDRARIVVCVGPGGVGKTTSSAAIAALTARLGRRTLVATIDPAPRLADALGVGALSPEPRAVPEAAAHALGVSRPDLLWAARLDTAQAFARLVESQVADPDMRRRIFANPIYRQITTALTGSQEYAATLALYEHTRSGAFDLIVLDTPPTAHALDFLEAPRRLSEAVASPAVRLFSGQGGGLSLSALRAATALVIKRMATLVGSSFLDDMAAFFTDFHHVLAGFLARAQEIETLLRQPDVIFLLVLAPELPAVDEALYFHRRLREAGIPLGGFIANRVQTRPGLVDAVGLGDRLAALPALAGTSRAAIDRTAERLARTALDQDRLWQSERKELQRLAFLAPGIPVIEVPLFDDDVGSLTSLRRVGEHLAGLLH